MEDQVSTFKEPLLTPSDNRYVMFPIVDEDIWKMYKKSVDSFGYRRSAIYHVI